MGKLSATLAVKKAHSFRSQAPVMVAWFSLKIHL
ncbi:hypothetical protein SPLC1_S203770 [Arthrospira platensis C1]|nr:hypothetical protein SPLC1_S203770 [Arthrospira platensis C1]